MNGSNNGEFLLAAFIIIISIPIVFQSTSPLEVVGNSELDIKEQMRKYAQVFMKSYNDIIEEEIDADTRQFLDFYMSRPYLVKATFSNTSGASLEFIKSDESSYIFRVVEERVEHAIFGVPTSYLLGFYIESDATIHDLGVTTNGNPFVMVVGNGSLLTYSIRVDSNSYPYPIIIKASQTSSAWSEKEARSQAQTMVEIDLYHSFIISEEYREFLAYPELEKLLKDIEEKKRNDPNYSLLDWEKDLQYIRELAKEEYGLENTDLIDAIIEYLGGKEVLYKKILGIQYENNWFYTVLLCCSIVVVYFFQHFAFLNSSSLRYQNRTHLAILYEIFRAASVLGVFSYFWSQIPFDYEYFSFHTVAIAVTILSVIIIVMMLDRRLRGDARVASYIR